MNVAVVGHVEWVEFVEVEAVPRPGEIVHALATWDEPAGGGAVAAVQLANLNGSAHLFTALGSDELGRRSRTELEARGVTVHASAVAEPQRRALTYIDADGERTITVLGRKQVASGGEGSLPWEELARCDAVFFVSGDVGALRAARRSRVLVATARELETLRRGGEQLDVLVGSGNDASERFEAGDLEPSPATVVTTSGSLGGWIRPGGPFVPERGRRTPSEGWTSGRAWFIVGRSGRDWTGRTMLGEHAHTLDEKNRLTLPARLRHLFGDGIVVTRGMDGCLFAYTRADWDRLVDTRLSGLDLLSQEGRRMQRFFFSGATEAELDKQGRVGIPQALLEHAKLGRDVVVAGVHDHLEIWDRDAWRRELAEVEGSAEDVAERLAAKRD